MSHLFLTGDGYLSAENERGKRKRRMLSGVEARENIAPGAGRGPLIGLVKEHVSFSREALGREGLDLFREPNADVLEIAQRNIRSYLARLSLDGEVLDADFDRRTDQLTLKTQLITYLSAERNGQLGFPLFIAIRKYLEQSNLAIMNLVLRPKGAKPLTQEEMQKQGGFHFPLTTTTDTKDPTRMVLPVNPYIRFDAEAALNIPQKEFPFVFDHGKRALPSYQPKVAPKPMLDSPFTLGATDLSVPHGHMFLLDGKVTHADPQHRARTEESVHHSGSLVLEAHGKGDKVLEFSTGCDGIPVRGLGVGGHVYAVQRTTPLKEKTSTNGHRMVCTIDEALRDSSTHIQDLLRIVQQDPNLSGILVQANGEPIVFPTGSALSSMVKYAVQEGSLPDERTAKRIPAETRDLLKHHPAIEVLKAAAANPGNHNLRRILLSQTALTAGDMSHLSNTAGVGAFFATALQLSKGDPNALDTQAVSTEQIERMGKYVRKGDLRLFWQAPKGPLRELVGLSFVDHTKVDQFRQLDHVTSVFCTHRPGMDAWLKPQLKAWLEPLLERDLHVGIATGASTGNMKALAELIAEEYPEVMLIGSANILPGQTPAFTEDAFTLFSGLYRRHRQTLLQSIADQFLAIPGGRGTFGEVGEMMVDISTKFTPPSVMGLVDPYATDEAHYFDHMHAQYQHATQVPAPTDAYMAKWLADHLMKFKSLGEYGAEVRTFMDDPLTWWKKYKVPEEIVKGSLENHIKNAEVTGRKPAKYYERAFDAYKIDPSGVSMSS